MADAEDRAPRFVSKTLNIPPVREHYLLDHGKTQTGATLLGGEVRFENLRASVYWHAWTVVANVLLNLDETLTKG